MIETAARSISAQQPRRVRRVHRIRQADVGRCRRRRRPRPRRSSRSRRRRRRASICQRATIGDLCVLACGRSVARARAASACTRSMLRLRAGVVDEHLWRGEVGQRQAWANRVVYVIAWYCREGPIDCSADYQAYPITDDVRMRRRAPGTAPGSYAVARETPAARRRRRVPRHDLRRTRRGSRWSPRGRGLRSRRSTARPGHLP